jgi:hypothetical protein
VLECVAVDNATTISVVDFRRQSMVLQWHALGGTWTACDTPPSLVHGIALIRSTGPNQYALSENSPRISCSRGIASFGFRRRFTVRSSTGAVLFSHSYWTNHGRDFYGWLANKAEDPDWRVSCGRQWSDGVASATLRAH